MSSQQTEDTRKTFAETFDRPFQERIVQAMVTDKLWAAQITEVLDVNYFEYTYLKQMAASYIGYYHKYKEFPSLELFKSYVQDIYKNTADLSIREQILGLLKRTIANKDLGDLPYVKESSMSFCKKQSFKNALISCAELVEDQEQYDRAVEIIKKSISAGQVQSPGLTLDSEQDVDARYSETYRNTIKTNIRSEDGSSSLDDRKIMNGGAGSGELNVIVATSGAGKSQFLVHVGAQALLQGKNVLHFTFELNERMRGIRYDSQLVEIDSLECVEHKEEIKEFYRATSGELGKLRIKYFPPGTTTVTTLRSFVDKLALENFKPDMVVVDYAGIMRSTEKYDLPRFELKKIYEELRGFAGDLNCPIWTACQSNKEGAESDIISLANMAEAYSQAHICDFVVGLGRPESQKASGFGTLFIAKNRAGMDGVQFKVRVDTSQSRFIILTEEEQKALSAEEEKEKEEAKNFVRRSYRELNAKKLLGRNSNIEIEKMEIISQ